MYVGFKHTPNKYTREWGKGAGAQGQSESRSGERLLQSSARIATRERTETYVSINDKGADKVMRPFLTLVENVAIWMKNKEEPRLTDARCTLRT